MAVSNTENPRAVDMFCGCGGMSLGFKMVGFDVVAAFDKWEPAMAVHRLNMPDTPVMPLDLSDVGKVIETVSPYAPDVMFGGAPCQAFSHAGKRRPGDPRASLTVAYAREIAGVRPAYAVMENVPAARNRPGIPQGSARRRIRSHRPRHAGIPVRVPDEEEEAVRHRGTG